MKYGVRTDIPGMTEEQYNQMHSVLGPKGLAAPGAIAHLAGPTRDGWYILEVWESKEDYERFEREEVLPLLPPDAPIPAVQEFEVHTFQPS